MTTGPSTNVGGNTIVTLARGVRLHDDRVRNQMVLLAPERAIALDEIAVAIIKALDGVLSLDEIAGTFALEFDAPKEQVMGDVAAFVRELVNRRMLDIVQ